MLLNEILEYFVSLFQIMVFKIEILVILGTQHFWF
jgi:hypothetical protein